MAQLRKHQVKRFGWIPDLPDHRDFMYSAPVAAKALPASVDLRSAFKTAPYDQGELGSCTANAIGAAVQFARQKAKLAPDFIPSRLFIYYNERDIEGTVDQDSGAMIRDGMKSVAKLGVCPETEWPYEIGKFTVKPPKSCYATAEKYQVTSYRRVAQTLSQLRGCLASGFPIVFGFTVYDSFESEEVKKTGVVPLPAGDEKVLGGHAVLAMGYDDKAQRFLVRNSWGPEWGMAGYFTMPYAYLTDDDLSDDFWTVRLVEG